MVELRDFRESDLDRFEPGLFDRQALERIPREVFRKWEGLALSVVEDGTVLGIGGLAVDGDFGHAWILAGDRLRTRYPVLLTRLARQGLEGLIRKYALRGVLVDVDPAFETSRRWLEWLGFEAINPDANPVEYCRWNRKPLQF